MENQRENGDNVPRNPLNDLYRLGEIERWHIVRMNKPQSVAEHSYFVTLLAMRLATVIGVPVGKVVHYALLHDAEEAWTGDIPSPVKRLVDKQGIPIKEMMGDMYIEHPEVLIEYVVKLADIAEALKYLKVHGSNTKHTQMIAETQKAQLIEKIKSCRSTWPKFNWSLGEFELFNFIEGHDETHIDDYL